MRYRPNKFLAKPERYAGPTMAGSYSHPGFHTTATEEVAACYAQAHGVPHFDVSVGMPIYDYPVIVKLDMAGLVPLADYDAEKQLWPDVLWMLREFFRMNKKATEHDLVSWLEFDPAEGDAIERGDAATDWLFKIGSWKIDNPSMALREFVESYPGNDVLGLLKRLADGDEKPSQEMLCALADQYRYLDDVDERRIVGVSYMRPFWPVLLSYEEVESDGELAIQLEQAGWAVLDVEDAIRREARVDTQPVYTKRGRPKRPEYHGTTYRNLLSAAPKLGRRLPAPPPPFKESP